MFSRSRLVAVAASAVVLFGLSGCNLFVPATDEDPLSDIAMCVMGHTWTLDTTDLSAQLLAELQREHPTVTEVVAAGSKTIEWGDDFNVDVTADLTITITATTATPDELRIVRQTQLGQASGKVYINSDVAIPRHWEDDVEVQTTAEQAGVELGFVSIAVPNTAFDDTVGLVLTCDAGTMTVTPRGSAITQRWTTG